MSHDIHREPESRRPEPSFDIDIDQFHDLIFDSHGRGHAATITYEFATYDGAVRVFKCEVSTDYRHVTQEDIEELLQLREGKSIVFECKIEIL